KRNHEWFLSDFMFQLTKGEKMEVIANCDNLKQLKFSPALPHVFTEHGVLMAANVLNSAKAVEISGLIVRAFVKLRERLTASASLEKRLAEIERTLISHDVALRGPLRQDQAATFTAP
ncbi:MAG TPA: ORF6N domain-containing protein, partial [bacterium]|nr:ORF6N domain-containing protein [bacterium]